MTERSPALRIAELKAQIIDNVAFRFLPAAAHQSFKKRLRIVVTRFAKQSADAFVASVIYHDEHRPRVLLNGVVGNDGLEAALRSLLYVSADNVGAEMARLGYGVGEGAEPPPYLEGRLIGSR